MKYTLIAFLLCSTTSCIHINSNGYWSLTSAQKQHLQPFSINATDSVRDQANDLQMKEITAAGIKQIQKKYKYTWLYYWIPYCHAEECRPLFYFERIDHAHRDKGLKFVLLSQVYDHDLIRKQVSRATLDRDIYVPRDAYYGHNAFRCRDRFMKELLQEPDRYGGRPAHIIFRDTQVIYYGRDMSLTIMDSVLQANR